MRQLAREKQALKILVFQVQLTFVVVIEISMHFQYCALEGTQDTQCW
ncbi:hypothetical protein SL1157_1699 [Ruegeria lacuscaerulensis ITI-1157]|nr:hypothetical protein SL1157_1699 [Ruegeria lacuscaerulensis ITI-1157]